MFFDTMLLYALASGLVWAAWIVWMFLSIWHYNVYSFFIAFAILMLAPVFFELILNIYGFLTSSSLLFIKHQEVWDKKYKDRFPIIYSFDYGSSLMWMERMHGLDSWLNFYIYRQIEEQEIVDSKIEEQEYNENKKKYEDAQRSRGGNRGTGDGRPSEYEDDEYQRRSRRLGGGNTLGKDRSKFDPNFVPDDVKFDPYEIKNFYHEPDSPSRAFLLDFMSIFYLFKLWYSFMLTAYLDVPALIFM